MVDPAQTVGARHESRARWPEWGHPGLRLRGAMACRRDPCRIRGSLKLLGDSHTEQDYPSSGFFAIAPRQCSAEFLLDLAAMQVGFDLQPRSAAETRAIDLHIFQY